LTEPRPLIVAFDEALLDLLLRRRDDGVAEPPAEVHGRQRHDLEGFARAGRLFDQNVAFGPADVGDQTDLVIAQLLGG
jgi:hypothetical protein